MKKTISSQPPAVIDEQVTTAKNEPTAIPVPPGGGRWKWNEAEGKHEKVNQPSPTPPQE